MSKYKINDDDISKNIKFFLKWAEIGKIIMIICAIIVALVSFGLIEDSDGFSLLFLLGSALLVFFSFIFENGLKWKAYMLHTNFIKQKND